MCADGLSLCVKSAVSRAEKCVIRMMSGMGGGELSVGIDGETSGVRGLSSGSGRGDGSRWGSGSGSGSMRGRGCSGDCDEDSGATVDGGEDSGDELS